MLETVNLHLESKGLRISQGTIVDSDDYRGAEFDEEPGGGARAGDEADQEGRAVVLRDEGACGGGQSDEDDPQCGGHGGEPGRCQGAAVSAARGRNRGLGQPGLRGTDAGDCRGRAAGSQLRQEPSLYHGKLNVEEFLRNREKSKVRSKVEHVFQVLKVKFGFVKVRYRGIRKNGNRLFALCALVNLYLARRKLLRIALA